MPERTTNEPIPVTDWLVLGSFPLRDHTIGRWTDSGFPCEADFAPQAGDEFNGARWVRYETPRGRIENHDPVLPYARRWWCFAYACSYVYSPAKQTVRLLLGNDNGAVVWLNGREVYRVDESERGVLLTKDVVTVAVRKGWNRLLVKMPQGPGFWGMMARFAGATDRKPPPKLRFAAKRPSVKQFPGLRRRQGGLVGRWSPKIARVTSDRGRLTFELQLDLFNDTPRTASRVRVALADGNGNALAGIETRAIPSFTSRSLEISGDAEALVAAMLDAGSRSLCAVVKSSVGTASIGIPPDALARLFCWVMTDLAVPLPARGESQFVVPRMFAGFPARIETEVLHPKDADRDWGQPVLPDQQFDADQTRQSELTVKLHAPVGMSGVTARIVFGEPAEWQTAARVRRLVDDLGFDVTGCIETAADGFGSLFHGDVDGAWQAIRAMIDRISADQPDRKSESVVLVGHAHIDMNWLWTFDETVQCSHDTFRQVLAFFDEFPDFHFSQSQPSVYEMIEQFDPPMFERIRRRVAEGRWELLGGFLTEGDTNLASGEGLARSLLIGQRYFRSRFGKMACVGWLPDNFGHAGQLPQIHRLAGIDFFYAHRCQPGRGAYVWEGIDGSRTLTFATATYNTVIGAGILDEPAIFDPKHRKSMSVYGVGNHGGGPTRRDLDRARAYDDTPGSPTIRCGTAEAFFRSIEPHADDYDVHRGERQFTLEGCYTSVARVKHGNREGENLMFAGEMLAALGALHGDPYPCEQAYGIWHKLAFNQFHDILCGSASNDSNRESIARYDEAVTGARTLRFEAMRRLTGRIDTQSYGQPVVVFNPLPRERSDIAEVEVYSHQLPPTVSFGTWYTPEQTLLTPVDVGQGPCPSILVVDTDGAKPPAQVVDTKLFPNGHRLKVQFPAERIPACGHKVFHVFPTIPGEPRDDRLVIKGTSVETPCFKVDVDPKTGHLKRVWDRRRKCEVLARGEPANVLTVYMEKPHAMSAWELGPISETHTLDRAQSVRGVEWGPVRAVIQIERQWNRSSFIQRVIVYRDLPRVDFELDVTWFERGGPDRDAPTLRVAFPLNVRNPVFTCDTPFAAIVRPTNGQEVPAQKWIDLSDIRGGAALLNAGQYGHRCTGRTLETTLLRASYEPDPYPDQGPHLIRYALVPHAGRWDAAGIADAGLAFNVPLTGLEAGSHAGEFSPVHGFIELQPDNLVLSGIKKPEDGDGLIVRFYEIEGKATRATLRIPQGVRGARRVNLLEDPLDTADCPTCATDRVVVPVRPHEIVSLRVDL
ncbi:MAG: alpha-mannosidase [Phycisphaerales bacterium]|nr:MAG: alpha-mannosidase [Phycisphaerales bacterium]